MKALVLAGGFPQIELINELHRRGIFTILADYYEEPVAKKFADKFYRVSTLDEEGIKKVAIDEKVDFIITVCTDQALLTVAKVSEELGLPCYIDRETALNVTNKLYMKSMFVQNGIPTARHIVTVDPTEDELSSLRYPLIVKPADCNSSKGVIKAVTPAELKAAFDKAKGYSRTHTAIIEEFIEGIELTVDAYVDSGKAEVLSVSVSEKIKDNEKFIIFRTFNPAPVEEKAMEQIRDTVQKIASAFGLTDSPMLVQMLYDGENAYVIEFSARTGGGVKYSLIRTVSGFDVIKAVVDLTLGKKPHTEPFVRSRKYLTNEFIYCRTGIYDHVEGFDQLKSDKVITDYYVFKWKGAEIDGISSSGDRIAGFTIEGDSIEELREKHCIVNNSVKVISADGNDIMRHDLLANIGE